MKIIKRILALIPAILVLLWCIVPFGSMAADSATNLPPNSYEGDLSGAYPSIDQVSENGLYCTTDYLMYNVISANGNNIWTFYDIMQYYFTIYIPLNRFDYSVSDGIYSFSLKSGTVSSYAFLWFASCLISSSGSTLPSTSYHSTLNITTGFTFDTNTNTLLINNEDFLYHTSLTNNDKLDYYFMSYDFVLNSEPVNKGEIIVDSFPKLEGDSTLNMYLLDDNGYPIPGKTSDRYLSTQLIDIDVKNNSTKPFQFCLYFAEKGGTLELNTQYRQFLGSRFYSNNPLFVYLTEENFYNYDITSHMNRTVNAVSCYHLVQPGQTFTCHVGENQLDLKKGVEYDLVVFGAFIDNHTNAYLENHILDTQFSLFNISGMDPYISLAGSGFDCKEYYRSTFVLDKTSDYKNTQYSNSGDLQIGGLGTSYNNGANQNNDNVFNTIYGQTDQNGNSSYKNSSFSENYGSYHMSYGDGSGLSSISNISLSSSFSSVFGMVTDFFNKLPKGMQDAFTFGFTAVIVIGIIKAVT